LKETPKDEELNGILVGGAESRDAMTRRHGDDLSKSDDESSIGDDMDSDSDEDLDVIGSNDDMVSSQT